MAIIPCNVTNTTTALPVYDDSNNAVIYIVVVLSVYSTGIVIAMVKYLKKEKAEQEQDKIFSEYFKYRLYSKPSRKEKVKILKRLASVGTLVTPTEDCNTVDEFSTIGNAIRKTGLGSFDITAACGGVYQLNSNNIQHAPPDAPKHGQAKDFGRLSFSNRGGCNFYSSEIQSKCAVPSDSGIDAVDTPSTEVLDVDEEDEVNNEKILSHALLAHSRDNTPPGLCAKHAAVSETNAIFVSEESHTLYHETSL